MNMVMRVILFSGLLVSFLSMGMTPAPHEGEEIQWVSIEEAYELAQQDGKKILIDFYTDWCGWCKKLDADTYSKSAVIEYINETYHAVKFDAERKEALTLAGRTYSFINQGRRGVHEFAAVMMNGKPSYPSTSVLDANLRPITTVPGYHGPQEMLMILSFLGGDYYQTTSWEEYQRNYQTNG